MQDSDARYVRLLDRVRPEMMGPDHWLKGCDDHVIMTADRYNMVMCFTGMRLFHH